MAIDDHNARRNHHISEHPARSKPSDALVLMARLMGRAAAREIVATNPQQHDRMDASGNTTADPRNLETNNDV